MKKKLRFNIGGLNIIDNYSDENLAIVEVYVCHDGDNHHHLPIPLSSIEEAKKTLLNKPLVAGFNGFDFKGHEEDEEIVGIFPESSHMEFVEKDGRTYLVAHAIMYKLYAKWAYDVFVKDPNNYKSVSMEITVLETETRDDGLEYITKFIFNGVTLLGDSHKPACEGANASIIKFSKENALQFYSKHFEKKSDAIKQEFVDDMKLANNFRKEDGESMKEEDKKKIEEEKEEKEKVSSDQDAYMEEEKEKEIKDEEAKMEKDEEKDKEKDEEKEDREDKEEKDNKEGNFESLNVEQKYTILHSVVKESFDYSCFIETFDDEYIYICNFCDGYTYRYSYTIENREAKIDLNSKTRVMRGGYVEFSKYQEEVKEFEALKDEVENLRSKLAEKENIEKSRAVESILCEIRDVIPAENIAELREKSAEYSLDNLVLFENEVKAMAFEVVAKKEKNEKTSINRMSFDNENVKKTSKYGW